MENFRVGVVGCGGIAQVHGTVLQHLEGVELVGCADIKPERAQAFAETYGGRAYSSMEELLEHEQLDAVHLCTPHYLHTPMAKLAASRGLHVFTEKPPVMTWEQWAEFRQLEQAPPGWACASRTGITPALQLLRELLASGKAGKVLGARAFVTWHREAPYYTESGWRGSLQTEGGGVLINQSIHTLDLLGQFLGRATQVEASMMNHHLKGVIEVEDMMEPTSPLGRPTPSSTPPPPIAPIPPCWWSSPARTPPSVVEEAGGGHHLLMAAKSATASPPSRWPAARPIGAIATACASRIFTAAYGRVNPSATTSRASPIPPS